MNRKWYQEPLLFLFVLVLLAVVSEAFAGEIVQINKQTGGDVAVDGGSTWAFSHGLGDTDLGRGAACVVTTQWGTIIWSRQNFHYDLLCISGQLDAQGKHEEAALLRCQIPELRKAPWGSIDTTCMDAMHMDTEVTATPELAALYNQAAQYQEDEEERDEQRDELYQVQLQVAQLEDQAASYEQTRRTEARKVAAKKQALREEFRQ